MKHLQSGVQVNVEKDAPIGGIPDKAVGTKWNVEPERPVPAQNSAGLTNMEATNLGGPSFPWNTGCVNTDR